MEPKKVTIDGNEAAAYVAYYLNEVCAIYPITPSSNMGELCDEWASQNKPNMWGVIPTVQEMQSEGGAAGAVHGALQNGALTTTFTASQGLLLMIPNMYKIAGELTSTVFHVTARSIAAQGLSIFGDHSDVMAVRQTGFGMICSASVQEAMDMALIAQGSTLESRIPFMHFFDGFRTSHEVMKIEQLTYDDMKAMISEEMILNHRKRALTPDNPFIRGTAQNPDVYFQARETVNKYYNNCPAIVQKYMDRFGELTGRKYKLFDYYGHPEAERIIVIMGSGSEPAKEMTDWLIAKGEKVGMVIVRLYRPFSLEHLMDVIPATVEKISVLDRTKEPGSGGEPLYLDVVNAITESFNDGTLKLKKFPKITGGRYGLSSKEFTTTMVKAVYDELKKERSKNHFTIGIIDDVTNTSLDFDSELSVEEPETFRGMFFGLGADGTVGANKNSIKIIGEETDNYAQGYFVYDSKKSGSMTTSHLRFGPKPIRSTYLITKANFIACHQPSFLDRIDMLANAEEGATFLLNTLIPKEQIFNELPKKVQQIIIDKKIKFYVIDAYKVAKETGMGLRINSIMQTCFFAISNILPREEAIAKIKKTIEKTYGKKGEAVVKMNFDSVDKTLENLFEVTIPKVTFGEMKMRDTVSSKAPEFVRNVTSMMIEGKGDLIPVSMLPDDGTYPSGTAMWEKRNIALEVPVWDMAVCIQCNKCAIVCPHAAIRPKVYDASELINVPETFKYTKYRGKEYGESAQYSLQVAVEDCTGCGICVEVCPAKNKQETKFKAINMVPHESDGLREKEAVNFDYFLNLPEVDRTKVNTSAVKDSQFLQPLFEFSGACLGCGETPYVKLVSQLFGDRAVIANATGCSSIYGGNLPTTPWTVNKEGRGPAWSNSLFEDNSEFGLGYRLAIDKHNEQAQFLLKKFAPEVGDKLVDGILNANQDDELGIFEQRARVKDLKKILKNIKGDGAKSLDWLSDYLVKKSVWIMGGDGWAYDIGFGGLDHVLLSGKNVNVLVLDTEVYSNTGGQTSKSTPRAAVAKFSAAGKTTAKKDLGLLAVSYGNVYVARVALGASDSQTLKAFTEAEKYDGPSLIIAYSHCIAHGINMRTANQNQKAAVESGHWPLFRFNPELIAKGETPFKLDSKPPKIKLADYAYMETRYKMLTKSHPEQAKILMSQAQDDVTKRWKMYEDLSADYQKAFVKI